MPSATIKPRRSKVGPKRGKRIMDPERREAFKAQRAQEEREAVEAAVRELANSEGWQRWVEARSRFHSYSLHNTMLIAMQRPDAERVASYKTWQSFGRQVMRGEKAIRILAPIVVKREEDGEEKRVCVGFKSVSVFDVGQTEGDALPELEREPITGDSHAEYVGRLWAFAEELGYSVESELLAEGHGGYCDPQGKRIVISSRLSVNASVRTLIHELAHALGVGYREYGRATAEVIVETAATIVCGAIGLDTSGESIPYIAGWGDGDPAAIRTYAEKIDELARRLEKAAGAE